MKTPMLKYKCYQGSVELSSEGDFLFGKIIGIKDVVTFEASTRKTLHKAFMEAVDDYLKTCKELAKNPEYPNY